MMAELCVCGHDHMWPSAYPGPQQYDECRDASCKCTNFRPCLPWPTEPGYWWCDVLYAGLADVRKMPSGALWIEGYGENGFEQEFQERYGPALFLKHEEPNPFEDTNG